MRLTAQLLIGASICLANMATPSSLHAQGKSTATDLYKKWRQAQPSSFREAGKSSPAALLPSARLRASKSLGMDRHHIRRPATANSAIVPSVGPQVRLEYRRAYPYRYGINSPYRYLIPGINYGVRSPYREFIPGVTYGVRSPDPQVRAFGDWVRATRP